MSSRKPGEVSALAIIAARNESLHISRCLNDLCSAGIEVVLIDNESEDDTVRKATPFLGKGLLSIEYLPWKGRFSLQDQLIAKAAIADASTHDWIVHADADERLSAPEDLGTLLEGISKADSAGAECINFSEFVFIPLAGEDFAHAHYAKYMVNYYFFAPYRPRLLRAWKRRSKLSNVDSGGHLLSGGDYKVYPTDFALRHYIMLSQEHGAAKYLSRRFAQEETERGWHTNRLLIAERGFVLPDASFPPLKRLSHPESNFLDTSSPVSKHFWE